MTTFGDLAAEARDLRGTAGRLEREIEGLREQLDRAEGLLSEVRLGVDLLDPPEPADEPPTTKPADEPPTAKPAAAKPKGTRRTPAQVAELKEAVLAEIRLGASITEAARRCGCHPNLPHNWHRRDPTWTPRYEEARKAQ